MQYDTVAEATMILMKYFVYLPSFELLIVFSCMHPFSDPVQVLKIQKCISYPSYSLLKPKLHDLKLLILKIALLSPTVT